MNSSRMMKGSIHLAPRRIHLFLLGGLSLLGIAGATAENVQITLHGNEISVIDDVLSDDLFSDLTGDGIPDLIDPNGLNIGLVDQPDGGETARGLKGFVANSPVEASHLTGSPSTFDLQIGGLSRSENAAFSMKEVVVMTIRDERINGGEATGALLEIEVGNDSYTDHWIRLLRVIFDNEDVALPGTIDTATVFPEWYDPIIAYNTAHFRGVKAMKRINALEKKIKTLKVRLRQLPRSVRTRADVQRIRKLAALQRQETALMLRLGHGA